MGLGRESFPPPGLILARVTADCSWPLICLGRHPTAGRTPRGSKPAAPGSLENPSSFVSPSPFFHRAERRRPWRPEGPRPRPSPAPVRSGAAGTWPLSSPSPLFSLCNTQRQRAMAAGGRPRRPRRSPRRCARSPVRGRAAVERPRGGAREPVRARGVSQRRQSAGELRPDPFIPRGVMDGRRWSAQVGSPPPLFLARVRVSFSRSDLDRISFFPFCNSFDPSSDPFPNRSTSLDRLTDTNVRTL